jgi:ribonuclease VapC
MVQMVAISQLNEAGLAELELLLNRAQIQLVHFNADHMRCALHGWRYYRKGQHQAALNLGDCFSYGLARAMDAPLMFKGEDFHYTDVEVAV